MIDAIGSPSRGSSLPSSTLIIGRVEHGDPLDRAGFRKACAATVAYLATAMAVVADAPTAGDFAARMKTEFADRKQHGWIDLSASQLFATGRPI